MNQLSFFSAESLPPSVTDLSGLLASNGQMVLSPAGARISVVVDRSWRAEAIADLVAQCGLVAEIGRSEEGRPLVRTASVPELSALASQWTKGAVKAMPPGSITGPTSFSATPRRRSFAPIARPIAFSPPRELPRIATLSSPR